MKKLMIAAAIVCAAAFAQAGSYVWGLSSYNYTDHEGQALETGTAFLYLGTVSASDTAFDFSKADYVTKGGFDWDNYGYGDLMDSNLQSSDLITKNSGDPYAIILVEGDVANLDGYEGYYAIVTGVSAEGVIAGVEPIKYASLIDTATPVATTSYMSVPEPTSGLLLLLGVAGLALRRRRA